MSKNIPATGTDNRSERLIALVSETRALQENIQELSGNQIDAITDTLGRMWLLPDAQQKLIESEDLQRQESEKRQAILDALPAHIAVLDRNGDIVAINTAWHEFAKLNGHPHKDCGIGDNYIEVCRQSSDDYQLDAHRVINAIEQALAGKFAGVQLEYPCHSPDEQRWFRFMVNPLPTTGGAVVMHIDITELHAVELALRSNERWLAATLASMGDGLIATDEEGRVRFMNVLAEQLSGWSQVEAMGKPVSEIFRIVEERTRGPVRNPVLDALLTGTNVTLAENTILIGKDGTERPIDDNVAPIRDVAGRIKGAVLVFRDISERRRLEEHLRQVQKMEAIGQLAGGIAHDFNNILTVITGFSELLLDDTLTAGRRHEAAKNINVAANRAASLTRQILAYSRKQILVPAVLSLNHIVRDMEAMLQRLLGSNIELTVEADLELGPVMADPTQLGQVLLNLATNARDAMSQFGAGHLVIATKNVVLDGEVTRKHPEVYPGMYAMLSVTDTGTGITDDVLAHLFEPFFTTKAVGKGTGLGLATTYGIVKQSGGHIDVSSQPGKSTTFRIYLPIVEGTPAADVGSEQQVRAKGQETVLLVDDEDCVRLLARTVLERDGYLVLEAGSGIEGLEIAAKYSGQIDLLLTDLVMPKLSGHELAKRLKLVRPAVRVLIMSGHDEAAAREDSTVATGEAAFLQKPFRLSDLATKVRELLDRPSTDCLKVELAS
jgi:PAS domain S-box-containing protein